MGLLARCGGDLIAPSHRAIHLPGETLERSRIGARTNIGVTALYGETGYLQHAPQSVGVGVETGLPWGSDRAKGVDSRLMDPS